MPRSRMIPAQQRLAGRNPPGLQIDQRLIEQLEFFVSQRLAQIELQGAPRLDGLRHFIAEKAERAATVRLGAIKCHVGVLQQRVRTDPRRRHRNADAGADLDQMIIDLVAFAQAVDDSPRKTGRILIRSDVLLKHHEFIATKARDEILGAQHFVQAAGDSAQQLVAAGVTERIVDLLELIEVDEQ